MIRYVFATFQLPAFHQWTDAPNFCHYLGHQHRHNFHFRITVRVDHSDRDIEIVQLKLDAYEAANSLADKRAYGHPDFGSRSCEMIAEELAERMRRGGYELAEVEVSEDGENGTKVVFA